MTRQLHQSLVSQADASKALNQQRVRTLATLRDTLLPRLISGQLHLPDAGALAEVAKQAAKDARRLAAAGLEPKAQGLLDVLRHDPFQNLPPFETLVGDLEGACSRRINIQHRLVYEAFKAERTVRVLRMWTHYE